MQSEYIENALHGYTLSRIHASFQHLLSKSAYKSLLQSDTIDDIVVKLQSTGYSSCLRNQKIRNKKELIQLLEKGLKKEFYKFYNNSDSSLRALLTFFLHSYMIESFIYRISNPEDTDEELGFFLELNTLKFVKNFREIKTLIIRGSFMEKYFEKIKVEDDIDSNNMQIIKRKLLKYHIEEFYDVLNNNTAAKNLDQTYENINVESLEYMINVLKTMGSIQIIEIVLNTIHTRISPSNRLSLFPSVNDLNPSIRNSLSHCHSIDDLRSILIKTNYASIFEHNDLLTGLHVYMLDIFYQSFKTFNDLSCVFCYFKLKEQEIKNLEWIVEFLGADEKEVMSNIYTVD